MTRKLLSVLSLALVLVMFAGSLAACNTPEEATTDKPQSESQEAPSENETTSEAVQESDSDVESTTESIPEESSEQETDPIVVGPLLEGEHAQIVENADKLKNGVNAYFTQADRKNFAFENLEMQMKYALSADQDQLVQYLADKDGNCYVENTMDIFVRMKDGSVYYASNSSIATTANIYRLGYYFYEVRLEEQVFVDKVEITDEKRIKYSNPEFLNQCKTQLKSGVLVVQNLDNATDPYVTFGRKYNYPADKFNYLEITMKADALVTGGELFVTAGDNTGFSSSQSFRFNINNDGEYHTYQIPLFNINEYEGTLSAIRLDVNGKGATYEISSINLLAADFGNAPRNLQLRRSFNVYSDKMHQIIQVASSDTTTDIAEIGMLTELATDKVSKLIVKDKTGTHDTVEGVDWSSVEYVGFDVKGAGIFGYILPYDGQGGKLTVSLSNGKYIIEQTATPTNNTILPSTQGTNNANDFYMGQRIYTDDSHDFTQFLHEAYCERNPLTKDSISVDTDASTGASFEGYDTLNGIYVFKTVGPVGGFNTSYNVEPNKHYRISFNVEGDDRNRSIYVMTHTTVGGMQTAVLLDKNDVLLPVPIEAGKNYSEQGGERNIFNLDDSTYGQTIFPMVIEADSKENCYTVLNLYHNWGKYPIKHLAWIQFLSPYYFLSTGVTETNCILPWYHMKNAKSLNTLPDHRTMSAPFWLEQPQHNSCGTHNWLIYKDEAGKSITSENVLDTIDSYGPIYADVRMDYISDDGRIKVSYTHTEMPQLDENRVYYEMRYEVLEDISFKDFSRDFQFYSVTSNVSGGKYTRVGYLNEKNESIVVPANKGESAVEYVLGENCPYFSYFDMDDYSKSTQQGYANVSFLVYNYDFIIGGQRSDAKFAIVDHNGKLSISLALDEVTLKAGDTFTINAILLPWGSQELESVWDTHQDKNVRDVRINSLLNPLKAVAGADCEVIESVYVPKVKTTNGKSVEFTLSGGHDNCAVRVYGFEKMTVPVIYEKINSDWVKYDVSSIKNPDSQKNAHRYDGYGIHYDGDGTFSYSFIVTMNNGAARTFRVVADGNYEKWEKETKNGGYADISVPETVVDPSSGYTLSDRFYAGNIDCFCGLIPPVSFNSVDGIATYDYNTTAIASNDILNNATVKGHHFVLSGWMMVEGGVSKYVWSADDGKTWHDTVGYGREPSQGSDAMISGAINRVKNAFTFSTKDIKNTNFQGFSATNPEVLRLI